MELMRSSGKEAASRWKGVLILVLPVLLTSSIAGAQKNRDAGIRQPVVWQVGAIGDPDLKPVFREAITDALHAVAREAEVVICYDDGALTTDAAFETLCRDEFTKKSKTQVLRFNPDVYVSSKNAFEIAAISLTLSVESTKKRKSWPNAALMSTKAQVFAPPDYSTARTDALLAKGIYDAITRLPPFRDWFMSLDRYPRLLMERPPGAFPLAATSQYAIAEAPPEAATAQRWYEEREKITDLLIEGQPAEAKGRADALLGEPIPEDLRARIEELRDKAVMKITEMTSGPEEPEPEPEPPPAPKPLDVSFTVRVAQPGSGFRSAIEGRLRISDRDIRFKPVDSKDGNGWSVSWWSLKSFGKATGLWDVAHPLVIETKDGTKHFLAEVTKKGVYGRGEEILKYIDRGRNSI